MLFRSQEKQENAASREQNGQKGYDLHADITDGLNAAHNHTAAQHSRKKARNLRGESEACGGGLRDGVGLGGAADSKGGYHGKEGVKFPDGFIAQAVFPQIHRTAAVLAVGVFLRKRTLRKHSE